MYLYIMFETWTYSLLAHHLPFFERKIDAYRQYSHQEMNIHKTIELMRISLISLI